MLRTRSDGKSCGAVIVGVLVLLLTVAGSAVAQDYQVLLVGDSWGELIWTNGTLDTVFAANGRPDLHVRGDLTAISGSKASEWATAGGLQQITNELDAYPTIEVVHLIIGGNDFLAGMSGGGWYQGMGAVAEAALFAQIVADIETVIDHILAHDPEIEVVLSSYDYPNLVESLVGPAGTICTGYYNDLGQPTPEQINTAGAELEVLREAMVATKARAFTTNHWGLMQWTYGFPGLGIAPGTLVPPGDLTLPSPQEAMLLGIDCTHLSPASYQALVQEVWDGFYDQHFNAIFSDGFESGNTTRWSSVVP